MTADTFVTNGAEIDKRDYLGNLQVVRNSDFKRALSGGNQMTVVCG